MIDTRKLFGITRIEEKDFDELNSGLRIDLKYYKTKTLLPKSNNKKYGIEIIKQEIKGKNKTKEKRKIYNLTNSEKIIENLLNIFIENKVTPIETNDILADLRENPAMVYNFKN